LNSFGRILKFAAQRADTCAVGNFLRRRRTPETVARVANVTEQAHVREIAFRPDLMIRWDDESAYHPADDRAPVCAQDRGVAARPAYGRVAFG